VVRATIDRVVMLGFEVRVELTNAATGGTFTAQITRGDAEALGLKAGDTVYVRATRVPSIPEEALTLNDTGADAPIDETSATSR
jgi:sulfate transport system ATP-binding protein